MVGWLTRTVSVQLNLATVIVVCQASTLHSVGQGTNEVAFEFSSTFDFHEICYIDSHKKNEER